MILSELNDAIMYVDDKIIEVSQRIAFLQEKIAQIFERLNGFETFKRETQNNSAVMVLRIYCEKCQEKDIYLKVPMMKISEEQYGETEGFLKFTFQCVRCGHEEEMFGTYCFACGGMGYHCHVTHGTTCPHCNGTGINAMSREDHQRHIRLFSKQIDTSFGLLKDGDEKE